MIWKLDSSSRSYRTLYSVSIIVIAHYSLCVIDSRRGGGRTFFKRRSGNWRCNGKACEGEGEDCGELHRDEYTLAVVVGGLVGRCGTGEGCSAVDDDVERAGGSMVFISFSLSS